jgi:hypothetical protein
MVRLLILAAALLIACNPDSTGPQGLGAGQWEGRLVSPPNDVNIVMTLSHNRSSGTVSGSGTWGAGVPLTVQGRISGLSVVLTLAVSSSVGTVSFDGTLSSPRMTGTMRGPGFQPASVTFLRQEAGGGRSGR